MDPYWLFLQNAAKNSSYRPSLEGWKAMWPSFCGPPFDRVSKPCGLRRNELVVEVDSEQWRLSLEQQLPEIEKRIASLGWGVNKITLFDPKIGLSLFNQPNGAKKKIKKCLTRGKASSTMATITTRYQLIVS